MKVYLAGTIAGLKYDKATAWREFVIRKLEVAGIQGYSPMRAKDFLSGKTLGGTDDSNPLTSGKGIVTRDRFDVTTCDLILVNLLGAERVSIGTMIELGWADAFRKPIVLVMEEGNVHQHLFLHELSGFIVPTLKEALDITIAILNP